MFKGTYLSQANYSIGQLTHIIYDEPQLILVNFIKPFYDSVYGIIVLLIILSSLLLIDYKLALSILFLTSLFYLGVAYLFKRKLKKQSDILPKLGESLFLNISTTKTGIKILFSANL